MLLMHFHLFLFAFLCVSCVKLSVNGFIYMTLRVLLLLISITVILFMTKLAPVGKHNRLSLRVHLCLCYFHLKYKLANIVIVRENKEAGERLLLQNAK